MAFERVKEVRLFGVTNQNSTVRLPIGDSSGGTATAFTNPLRDALVWDQCDYLVLGSSVAGGATGGSYTLLLETDALSGPLGVTALPIAGVSGIGPNTRGTIVLTNLHRSSGSPLPTHLRVTQDAAGGGIWFQVWALAKQYRGVLGTPGSFAERCIAGIVTRGASYSGGPYASGAGFGANQTVTGASLSRLGLHRIRLWDKAFYWVIAGQSLSGTHNVSMVGQMSGGTASGFTFTIASTVGVNQAPLGTAGRAIPLQSNFFGNAVGYSAVIWTVVSAGGVSDARIIALSKTGRGSLYNNERR